MQAVREIILAAATGVACGGAASFKVTHTVWERAQSHGDGIDSCISTLRISRGLPEQTLSEVHPSKNVLGRTVLSAWQLRARVNNS